MLAWLYWMVKSIIDMSLSGIANLKFVLENENFKIYDDEEENNSQEMKIQSNLDSSEVLAETRGLLRKRSSTLSLEEGEGSMSHTGDRNIVNDSSQPVSILGTKHVRNALPIIKNIKLRKAVRFDMDKNETCEIQQPEFNTSFDSASDSDADININRIMGNVMDASSLLGTDKEDDKNDSRYKEEETRLSYSSSLDHDNNRDILKIQTDIGKLQEEKMKLERENKELHNKHEKEMKQLREEYKRRREDYYDELDEVQRDLNDKRKLMNNLNKNELLDDFDELPERRRIWQNETAELDAKEKEIKKRKQTMDEDEKEMEEYQVYLNRRHKTLSEKEKDLCTLQDDLEELDDMLKEKEKTLNEKKIRLNVVESNTKLQCDHNENEIERTRLQLIECLKSEQNLSMKLESKQNELNEQDKKISTLESQYEELYRKTKHLETQLAIYIKPTHTHHKTSLTDIRQLTGIPLDEQTGEYLVPKSSPRHKSTSPKKEKDLKLSQSTKKNTPSRKYSQTTPPQSPLLSPVSDGRGDNDSTIDEFPEQSLYAYDTTEPKKSVKSTFSKTCLLM